MLEGYGAVRKALEANGLDTQKDDISAEQVEEAIKACGQTADPEYIEVCRRAMKRAKIIAKTFPEGSNYRKNVFVRQRDKDHDVRRQVTPARAPPPHVVGTAAAGSAMPHALVVDCRVP